MRELAEEHREAIIAGAQATGALGIPPALLAAVICLELLRHSRRLRRLELAVERRRLAGGATGGLATAGYRLLAMYRRVPFFEPSLGVGQLKLSTAAMLLGHLDWREPAPECWREHRRAAWQAYEALAASTRRDIVAILGEPRRNIALAAQLLARLKNRQHRFPGLRAMALASDERAVKILVTEYNAGPLACACDKVVCSFISNTAWRLMTDRVISWSFGSGHGSQPTAGLPDDWLPGGMITRPQLDFVLQHLRQVLATGVPGDVVEMGCHAGTTTALLRRQLDNCAPERALHAYDSFAGLPAPHAEDAAGPGQPVVREGNCRATPEQWRETIRAAGVREPELHIGDFGALPESAYPATVAFAFFDGDLHRSLLDSFRRIYPRLAPGGIICVHDYDWGPLPGVRRACEDFLADKPETVTEVFATVAVIRKLRPATAYRIFTPDGFCDLVNRIDLPHTRRPDVLPPITGYPAADEHLRRLAAARGYVPRPLAVTGELVTNGHQRLQREAMVSWYRLHAAAGHAGIRLGLLSAYRSPAQQQAIFAHVLRRRLGNDAAGALPAERIAAGELDGVLAQVFATCAPPGYSLHHTGYACDFIDMSGGESAMAFAGTPSCAWLAQDNHLAARRFGFIPSYPEGTQQGPDPEAWEYLWVGEDLLLTGTTVCGKCRRCASACRLTMR